MLHAMFAVKLVGIEFTSRAIGTASSENAA